MVPIGVPFFCIGNYYQIRGPQSFLLLHPFSGFLVFKISPPYLWVVEFGLKSHILALICS